MRCPIGPDGLTDRMRRFVAAVRAGMNGREAARTAGYAGSDTVLTAYASKLRKHARIVSALGDVPSRRVYVDLGGERFTVREIAEAFGLPIDAVRYRLAAGDAGAHLTRPSQRRLRCAETSRVRSVAHRGTR